MFLASRLNTITTPRSATSVVQLATERDTMRVTMTLNHTVSTSNRPATPATDRAASGTTIGSP
jgi:hypothetical protein